VCRIAHGTKQGDHICASFETEEEPLAIAAGHMADRLRRGERCLYVSESAAGLERFREVLEALGVDTGARAPRVEQLESRPRRPQR
jgi:hypothetical protein